MTDADPRDQADHELTPSSVDGDATVVLAQFDHEWQASLVRETLLAAGIPSMVAGGLTGSFRAEAPGRVKVLVRSVDRDRAMAAIEQRREEAAAIDWTKVDLRPREDDAEG